MAFHVRLKVLSKKLQAERGSQMSGTPASMNVRMGAGRSWEDPEGDSVVMDWSPTTKSRDVSAAKGKVMLFGSNRAAS